MRTAKATKILGKLARISLVAAAAALITLMMGCTKKQTENSEFPKEKTLYINLGSEPPTLDWNLAGDNVSVMVILSVMDPLLETDLSDPTLPVKPGLLTKWEHSKDFKTWTFQLKKNVKWSDGTPLTSQHIVDSFERLLSPKTGASATQFVDSIVGSKEFFSGELKDFSKVGVKALSDFQLEFKLRESLVFFDKVMTIHNVLPIRKDLIEKHGNKWTEPQNLVTLGPYLLKEWKHDQHVILQRNPNYHDKAPAIKFVFGRMIPDMSTARDLFLTGKLDIQDGIATTDEKRFKDTPEFVNHPLFALFFIMFNCNKEPFKNAKVRRMIAHSIDRQEILDLIGGTRRLNTGFLPKGLLAEYETGPVEFSPEKALKIFTELTKKQRHALQKVVLSGNNNETHKLILENMQAQIKRNLGVEIEIQMEEWKTYLNKIKLDPPAMFRLGWISLYSDPHLIMSLFRSDSKFNYTGWKSEKYDELVSKAATEGDVEKRRAMYLEAQEHLVTESPMMTVYTGTATYLVSKRVGGFQPNSLEKVRLKNLSLKN
ncbi:MAG: peptide ABC transporter substrate-binding protein [Bdellovibrionales bacterium]|nr:peptide ABC transporter substrate-binding protein [Bdellovibrionales bacterium]